VFYIPSTLNGPDCHLKLLAVTFLLSALPCLLPCFAVQRMNSLHTSVESFLPEAKRATSRSPLCTLPRQSRVKCRKRPGVDPRTKL
jgi:hypothetical protein